MRVLAIGDNCVDITVKGDFEFEEDKNIIPDSIKITPAGTGVNFSTALSTFGCEVFYFASLGKDIFSTIIEDRLDKLKVKKDFIKKVNKNTAIIVAIVGKRGERTTFAGIKDVSYEYIDVKLFEKINIENFSGVYISGGILTSKKSQESIIKIVDILSKKDATLFFDTQIRIGKDIEGFIDTVHWIMERSDIVFSNLKEYSLIKEEIKYKLLNKGKIFVVKMGEKGAKIVKIGKELVSSGIKVESVDTTGAGDVFNASFIYKYLKSGNLKESLDFANMYGALSTTKLGVYIPKRSEISKFMKRKEEGC